MLQLRNIRKAYTTGSFTQTALDDVSISFRDSEFVAILGPVGFGARRRCSTSSAGSTTTTRATSSSTASRPRNTRIATGTPTATTASASSSRAYNLIPHQTVLANVELALTLSGVSRAERRTRALDALRKVGLSDHVDKKPSQLSGGQMQRVAIARALINDPEILLADEPTGALDSKTSVQIMDLLTEIANDRLVIMVTHNPELAEQYATRIVNLADGVIRSDSNPFDPAPEDMRVSKKQVRRTSMSFLTALSLSCNNLLTKKGRTLMTAFAGSIGIIGIAADPLARERREQLHRQCRGGNALRVPALHRGPGIRHDEPHDHGHEHGRARWFLGFPKRRKLEQRRENRKQLKRRCDRRHRQRVEDGNRHVRQHRQQRPCQPERVPGQRRFGH